MPNITDLPDEVLEFILSLISPYQDLHECMTVSKRWRKCVLNVVKTRRRNLNRSISEFDVKWKCITAPDNSQSHTISKRYSHSAAIFDNSMYIFGGCTCSLTTFNDLWKFDLSRREWIRPLATGTYPSPKACSSLAYHNNMLILFGGWTYPSTYPLYQSCHLFDELHVYYIDMSHWSAVNTINRPPPTAGHSVSIINDWMIVFGGLTKSHSFECKTSNDVWKLNLNNWTWTHQEVQGSKPIGRFGHTQVILNDQNIFIIGGSGGSAHVYSDAWILNMSNENAWKWIQVEIKGKVNKPANIWSNPGCKVDDKLIVLNRLQTETNFPIKYLRNIPPKVNIQIDRAPSSSARIDAANRRPDLDENVNGRRGVLRCERNVVGGEQLNCEQNRPAASNIHGLGNGHPVQHRERQSLINVPGRLDDNRDVSPKMKIGKSLPGQKKKSKSPYNLGLYVLDLGHALDDKPYVTWLSPKKFNKGPTETILYSLVEGKSEVIMFGGIQNDIQSLGELDNEISNSIHFMLAKDHVI